MNFWQGLDYYHWLFLGLFILVIELLLGGGFLVWVGIAAVATGVLVLALPWFEVVLGWQGQLAIFVVCNLLSIATWWHFFHWHTDRGVAGADICGRDALLASPLRDGRGHVEVDGERVPITGPDLAAGTRVRLIKKTRLGFVVEAQEPVDDSE